MDRSFCKENNEDDVTAISRQGVEGFMKAKHIKLKRQHWSEDDDQPELLNKMSAGKRITPDDLKTYKLLQEEYSELEFATIPTPGNQERQDFNTVQSIRWAVKNKTHAIRWHKKNQRQHMEGKTKRS